MFSPHTTGTQECKTSWATKKPLLPPIKTEGTPSNATGDPRLHVVNEVNNREYHGNRMHAASGTSCLLPHPCVEELKQKFESKASLVTGTNQGRKPPVPPPKPKPTTPAKCEKPIPPPKPKQTLTFEGN